MGRAKLNGQSGSKINGIIEEYVVQAGSNISAGDFVEFINTDLSVVGSPTVLASYNANGLRAVELSDGVVLIVYIQDAGVSSYTTAQLLTVSGTTITYGTKYTITTSILYSDGYADLKKLSDTKAVFTFVSDSTNQYGQAVILTVNGTTISVGSIFTFNSSKTYAIGSVVLDSSRILVSYVDNGNSNYLTAMVLTISGTSLSAGTKYIVSSSNSITVSLSLIKIDKVMIGYTYVSGSYNYGALKILTISGTSISVGGITILNNKATSDIACIATSENYGFVVYRGYVASGTVYFMRIVPIEFNGTSVVCGLDASYIDTQTYEFTSLNEMSEGCYILAFNNPDYYSHSGIAILINTRGNAVSVKGNSLVYSVSSSRAYYGNVVPVSKAKAVAIYVDSSDSQVKAVILTINNYVRNAVSKNAIDGIAKTKAAAGETAKIYTL